MEPFTSRHYYSPIISVTTGFAADAEYDFSEKPLTEAGQRSAWRPWRFLGDADFGMLFEMSEYFAE
jgi:hypothetical protein